MPRKRKTRSARSARSEGAIRPEVEPLKKRGDARRVLPTQDWIAHVDHRELESVAETQILSVSHFYTGLTRLRLSFATALFLPPDEEQMPPAIAGRVVLPDGQPATVVVITLLSFTDAKNASIPSSQPVVTNLRGEFVIRNLPSATVSESTQVTLQIRGANGAETRSFNAMALRPSGILGTIQLKLPLAPLPQSVVGSLLTLVESLEPAAPETPRPGTPANPISLRVGDGDCAISFDHDLPQQRFPYSVLVRLIEPRPSILTEALLIRRKRAQYMMAKYNKAWADISGSEHSFTDRVPVDQPISVDGFRDRIMGNAGGTISDEELVPMAGTLGLGYMLHLCQEWTSEGLSLGDLVYSLPLAPGEQQRVAVFEQKQTLSTIEMESLDYDEQQQARQVSDSSVDSVFNSAFAESVRGSSSFSTQADSSSWGVAGGVGGFLGGVLFGVGAGGGGGSSSSSGSSSNSLDGTRNYVSTAVSNAHSAVEREASARRHAQRTGMRLASASDIEEVTTKVITNNNRIHALTMQYWEVLRHFSVSTGVQGVTLVCFVPLEVVRFLPPGVSFNLVEGEVATRHQILYRYGPVLKHADVLRRWVPFQYRQGLKVLEEFAANPRAEPSFDSATEDIVHISLTGTFLPVEEISVSVMTRRGTRLGPVRLSGTVPQLPDTVTDASNAFKSKTELVAELLKRRNSSDGLELTADITLPSSINPDDVVGFELHRRFRTLVYQLAPTPADTLDKLLESGNLQFALSLFPLFGTRLNHQVNGVTMGPSELEQELGGPLIWNFSAGIVGPPLETFADQYIGSADRFPLPADGYPIAARAVNPLLKFNELLQIEAMVQHVVRNTVTYSRAVWMSLTPEERAIMLEAFTIGVPEGGLVDETQQVPLLNCVANQVLGFYGNSMIMPFNIPAEVAAQLHLDSTDEQRPFTTAEVQNALTQFHRTGFAPPVSHVALPTRGVLGEAVLGTCPSAEKIDLTRFWNWQDSPIPQAADIAGTTLNKGSTLVGATAPSTLTGLPSIISNINAPPADANAALQALISGQNTKDLPNITGMDQLAALQGKTLDTAEKARADALAKAQTLASEGLKQAGNMMQAKAAADKQQQDAKTKADADAQKADAEAQKAADAKQKAGVGDLKTNAAQYLAVANSKGDPQAAQDYAQQILQAKFGSGALPIDVASTLFSTFHQVAPGGGDALTQGSTAFLTALGLL